jgi:hypothetical protein
VEVYTRGTAGGLPERVSCLHAYVPETAEYSEVQVGVRAELGLTFEPCHVSLSECRVSVCCLLTFEHAKTHRIRN